MSERYDIVVVGGGGSGLMAALTAARCGRSVVLIEKNPKLGGTTGLSVGTICTTGTPHQKRVGIQDTTDAHFEDMGLFAGALQTRDNLELRRLLVEEVPETFRLLSACGIEFMDPIPEPPHRHPRLHAIVPHSRGYIHHLSRACRKAGVSILTDARAEQLEMENGRVSGVHVRLGRDSDELEQLVAQRAVILACGDFSSAPVDYKARFLPDELMDVQGINPTSTGDGQRLGEQAGGEIVNGDIVWGPEIRFIPPPRPSLVSRLPPNRLVARAVLFAMKALPDRLLRPFLMSFVTTFLAPSHNLFEQGSILINRRGERFCDELERPQNEIPRQPEGDAFFVFDGEVAERFAAWPNYVSTAPGVGYAYLSDYERSRRDILYRADSVTELARLLGMDGARLSAAVEAHNASLEGRGGDRPSLRRPPFYALGPARSWIVFGEGGLRVDRNLRVLTPSGGPVSGLYAAGSTGQGGLILNGHGHHLGWAFTSGRLAGTHAAQASV